MEKPWIDIGSDMDWETHGGLWTLRSPLDPAQYYIIRHTDMLEAIGERDFQEYGCKSCDDCMESWSESRDCDDNSCACDVCVCDDYPCTCDTKECTEWDPCNRYICEVSLVDLDEISHERKSEAVRSCGSDLADTDPAMRELEIVCCLTSFGAHAPLESFSGRHADENRDRARECVASMIGDPDSLETALDRTVNKLGSSAREYAAGDFQSAILRGLAIGDPTCELMVKIGIS